MKPSVKITMAISLAVLVIVFIVCWDTFLKDKLDSVPVVVVKAGEEIKPEEKITPYLLTVERRSRKDLVENVVYADQMESIIGKDAGQLIVGNSMVSRDMIDWDNLVPDPSKSEAIRPIPDAWIYAIPGSLRRKDRINIYMIDKNLIGNVDPSKKQNTQEGPTVATSENTSNGSLNTNVSLLLENIRVVYAKDSSNNEVIGKKPDAGNDTSERLDATGKINQLELLLTDKQFNKISDAVLKQGKMLYITYQ